MVTQHSLLLWGVPPMTTRGTVVGARLRPAAKLLRISRAVLELAWQCPKPEVSQAINTLQPLAMVLSSTKDRVVSVRQSLTGLWAVLLSLLLLLQISAMPISIVVHPTPHPHTLRVFIRIFQMKVTCPPTTLVATTMTTVICTSNTEGTAIPMEANRSFEMFKRAETHKSKIPLCFLGKEMLELRKTFEEYPKIALFLIYTHASFMERVNSISCPCNWAVRQSRVEAG